MTLGPQSYPLRKVRQQGATRSLRHRQAGKGPRRQVPPLPHPQAEPPVPAKPPTLQAGACAPGFLSGRGGYRVLQLPQLLLQLAQLLGQLLLDVLLRLQRGRDLHVLVGLDGEEGSAATRCGWRPQDVLSASHSPGKGGGRWESPLPPLLCLHGDRVTWGP